MMKMALIMLAVPDNAVLFIITNPPAKLSQLLDAPAVIDDTTSDRVIAVSLANGTEIDLGGGEATFQSDGTMLWLPGNSCT
ncbi:MAG: hypothetical protein K6B72_04735 [Lachnospiraceae bacterium]|nr:hypothetical protein [Lachnospiraceae bacterium]